MPLLCRRRLFVPFATLALFAMTLAAPDVSAKRKRSKKRAGTRTNKILVLGSSSVNGSLGKRIEKQLAKKGFSVVRRGKSSAGLARPDYYDWMAQVPALPIDSSTRGAVVYLGTNDGQAINLRSSERKRYKLRGKWLRWGHKDWHRVYEARVTNFAKALCTAGVWRVAFMTPVDTKDPALLKRLRQIRRLQYRGARRSKCAWAYSGRGDFRKIRRKNANLPSGKRLRYKDGFHMTERGATVAWARLEKRIVRYLSRRKPRRLRTRRKKRSKRLAKSRKRRRKG
jgi:uncharacterized protein